MTRFAAALALSLSLGLAALACGGEATQDQPTHDEGWVAGELPPGNGGLPSGEPAGADDGEWGDAPYAVWFGEIERQDGDFGAASGGFMAVNMQDGAAYEACVATWTSIVVATPIDMDKSCSACEFVVELEYGEPVVEVDLDCAGWGFDPASIMGTHIVVGYGGGDTLYQRDVNGQWFEYGDAELADAYFYFDLEFWN